MWETWVKSLGWEDPLQKGMAQFSSVQFSSVQLLSRVWLFVTPWTAACQHHQLQESTQTHIHRVSDAIQPFHPLSSPSPPALNLSQHQGLFQWVSPLHQVAKILEFQLQHQSFQWTPTPVFWPGELHELYSPWGCKELEKTERLLLVSYTNAGVMGSILGLGRYPGEENGYPLQCSCLENSIDRGVWQAVVHEVAEFKIDQLILSLSLLQTAKDCNFWEKKQMG